QIGGGLRRHQLQLAAERVQAREHLLQLTAVDVGAFRQLFQLGIGAAERLAELGAQVMASQNVEDVEQNRHGGAPAPAAGIPFVVAQAREQMFQSQKRAYALVQRLLVAA